MKGIKKISMDNFNLREIKSPGDLPISYEPGAKTIKETILELYPGKTWEDKCKEIEKKANSCGLGMDDMGFFYVKNKKLYKKYLIGVIGG